MNQDYIDGWTARREYEDGLDQAQKLSRWFALPFFISLFSMFIGVPFIIEGFWIGIIPTVLGFFGVYGSLSHMNEVTKKQLEEFEKTWEGRKP